MALHDIWPRAARRFVVFACAGVLAVLVSGFSSAGGTAPQPPDAASRGLASPAQGMPSPGTRILFELVGTRRTEATGTPRTGISDNAGVGQDVEHTLSAGTPGTADLCDFVAPGAPDSSQFVYLWRVRAKVRSVSPTQTTLDVAWHRSGPDGQVSTSDEDAQTITLEPGEYRLLDYVRDRTDGSPCASVQLHVRADPLPQPGVQPMLTYDVWLVHDDGREDPRVVHRTLAARSGQVVSVDLEPLAWPSDGRTDRGQVSPPVLMKVRSTLAATLRADGSLDISVRADRTVSWGASKVRGAGQEDFLGALGETVSLLFPSPRGRATIAPDDRPSSRGRGAVAEKGVVDFASFFAGTQTSLYIRVSRRD